ncbi:hypothetical protein I3843_13G004700 [Carya illinoinensis]|nr:hypothetical protein I3843_13G004700 [Carya illinoinensis]
MVNLLQVKYQNSETSPFDTHGFIMSAFIVAIHVHAITLSKVLQPNQNRNCLPLTKLICYISGVLAYGLPLLILVPPLGWLILCSYAPQFIEVLHNSYQQIFELLRGIVVGAFKPLAIMLVKIFRVLFHLGEQESNANSGQQGQESAGDPQTA